MNLEAELAAYKVILSHLIQMNGDKIVIPKQAIQLHTEPGIKVEEVDGMYVFTLGEEDDTVPNGI